jgi:hypothetical protein
MKKTRAMLTLVLALLLGGAVADIPAQQSPPVGMPAPYVNVTPNVLRLSQGVPGDKAVIADVAWLVGRWKGTGLGGTVEQVWSPPQHGQMMGMFSYVKDGKIVFYEFLTLAEVDGTLALRVKHFNPDMTGWEEKDKFITFRFIKTDAQRAWFGGFTFERVGTDGWNGYLAMRNAAGETREEKFEFKRVGF